MIGVIHTRHLLLEEPRGTTLSQVCSRKFHGDWNGIMEYLGWELLRLHLAGGTSIECGSGSITCLGVCPAARGGDGHQHATLPVTAVQLWLAGGAVFDQTAPVKVLVVFEMTVG